MFAPRRAHHSGSFLVIIVISLWIEKESLDRMLFRTQIDFRTTKWSIAKRSWRLALLGIYLEYMEGVSTLYWCHLFVLRILSLLWVSLHPWSYQCMSFERLLRAFVGGALHFPFRPIFHSFSFFHGCNPCLSIFSFRGWTAQKSCSPFRKYRFKDKNGQIPSQKSKKQTIIQTIGPSVKKGDQECSLGVCFCPRLV